jgi:hypothetical protein
VRGGGNMCVFEVLPTLYMSFSVHHTFSNIQAYSMKMNTGASTHTHTQTK